MTGVLEVLVRHERDVSGAVEGGADRLLLVTPAGLSPEPGTLSAICRETDVPVHVVLRLNDSWTTTGGELTRLVGLAEDYLGIGAAGLAYGFLDPELEVDTEVCTHLATRLPGVPWLFHGALDHTLDLRRSWRRLLGLPGLAGVHSAGSPRGLAEGYDELLVLLDSERRIAPLLVPAGGLSAEQVPWLVRGGVRAIQLDTEVRPTGSPKAYVDAALVRSWRLLLDDAMARRA